jgi:5-methyltetrahydrofolate--homocysteine methyltransferase
MDLKQCIYTKVIAGDADAAATLTRRALEEGFEPHQLLNESLIAAMAEVGDRFEKREFFVPEMLIAARAMKAGVSVLQDRIGQAAMGAAGTVVIGTVVGDLHDIGKNLVVMMLEGAGFRVVDLGVDVQARAFVEAIRAHTPQLVGMSALLTTTMLSMRSTIEAIEKAGLRNKVKVMIGGAPVTQRFAEEIGADIYGQDANAAVREARAALRST